MKNPAATYKLLALAFHCPDESLLTGLRELPEFRETLCNVSVEELQREHTRLFSLTIGGGVPLYETEYGRREIFMKTQRLADIAAFYYAFGLEVPAAAHQRIDFIGAELELMSWLVLKERYAQDSGRHEEAQTCRDAMTKFMNDHLGRWANFLGGQIIKTAQQAFYRALGQRLVDFCNAECDRLHVHPDRIKTWSPAGPEETLTCEAHSCSGDGIRKEIIPV